jgi:aryl-alcohol dehydrogenase-like predicted oxidoreductase
MNRLALGTAQFGQDYGVANRSGQVSFDQIKESLHIAALHGVNTLDTAITYGNSESLIGKIGVEKFRVITKLPEIPRGVDVQEWIKSQVMTSLGRLNTSSVYGLLLHRPQQFHGSLGLEVLAALKTLKEKGVINKIGISIYNPEDLDDLPLEHIEIVQAPYNILDLRVFTSGIAKKLKDLGIELHTRSVFLQGLLLMPAKDRPAKFQRWDDLWSKWDAWLRDHDISAKQACLDFVLSQKEIDRVIVGFDSSSQLKELLEIASKESFNDWPIFEESDLNLLNPSHWSVL